MGPGCYNFGSCIDLDAAGMPEDARLTKAQRLADGYLTDRDRELIESLEDTATQRGHTLVEPPASWLFARTPVASVIAGATRPEQVQQDVPTGDWILTPEELAPVGCVCRASAAHE